MTSTTQTAALHFHKVSSGLHAFRAKDESFIYDIFRWGKGDYRLRVTHAQTVVGVTICANDGWDETTDTETLGLAKSIAQHYHRNTNHDTKASQGRMTRAIGAAYDEER